MQVTEHKDLQSNTKLGKGVYITTYGCQMNVNDTERMFSLLEMVNFVPVNTPQEADLIIINSCSVREKPVHKVHSEVGRYRELKKQNPRLKIGVGGCVGQQEKNKLVSDIPLLDFVFGTDAIDKLPQIVTDVYETGKKVVSAKFEHQKPYQVETLVRNPRISAFVNITKGCDNFCTFCVVPFTRGRERSRKLEELIKDINNLVKRGVKEVALLGQNVNSYKSSCGANFAALLKAIAEDTPIERIRYMTSHPKDFDQELCDISQKYRSKLGDYIHLPVQSGNSEVLSRMNRGYSRKEYLDKVQMIKQTIPGVVLSTDIIVGFPGETEKQYLDTVTLLKEVEYDSIYAYNYSPRPYTKAAKFSDQITKETKSRRLNELLAFQKEISFRLAKKYENNIFEILVEDFNSSTRTLSGRTMSNKRVRFSGSEQLIGKTIPVKVLKGLPVTLEGEIVSEY